MQRGRRITGWLGSIVGVVLLGGMGWWAYQQWERSHPVTFADSVASIIHSRCAGCHRPEQAAPFSLLTYEDVRKRGKQILAVTHQGLMPPWLPQEGHGDFVGSRRLTSAELHTLQRWVHSDMPLGDPNAIPSVPAFPDHWKAAPPDLVLESPAYHLNSQTGDVFRNFVIPTGLEGPRWVESIELRPLNPKVTHHARLGVDTSHESVRRNAEDNEPGYAGMAWGQDPDGQLVIWAPGLSPTPTVQGVAWRLYPHTCLVLHTHMQPSGKAEIVKFQVGIRFAKQPPATRPAILRIGSCDIDIPANAARHTVKDQYTLPIDVEVHSIFPHAHSLCQSLSVWAERPDGSHEPLVSIEHFDENWHDCYRYRQPVHLPRGTRLVSTFTYDNTDGNTRNRSRPARRVVYGSNVSDEMADVYLQVTASRPDQRSVLMEEYHRYELQAQAIGYRRALELYPADPWNQEGLATCYVGLGELAKARTLLQKRLSQGKPAVHPTVGLGMVQLMTGDLTGAEARLRQALELDNHYPLAWMGLGKTMSALKKTEDAQTAYRRVMELAPDYLEARLNLADLLIQQGKWADAQKLCLDVAEESPEFSGIYLKLAEISAKQKKYDESLAYCRQTQLLAPYTHPPKVLLAVFCQANGEKERALQLLSEARVESKNHPMPSLMLGQLLREQQPQQAWHYYQEAAALPTPDTWPVSHLRRFQVLLHSDRFQLAMQLNRVDLAREVLSQWSKVDPANPQLLKWQQQLATSKR